MAEGGKEESLRNCLCVRLLKFTIVGSVPAIFTRVSDQRGRL